jgi:hypothetical protein
VGDRLVPALLVVSLGANVALAVVLASRPAAPGTEAIEALRAEVAGLREEVRRGAGDGVPAAAPAAAPTLAAAPVTPRASGTADPAPSRAVAADPPRVSAAAPARAPSPVPPPPRPAEDASAWDWANHWSAEARQLADAGRRSAALDEMRRALGSSDRTRILAGLYGYTSTPRELLDLADARSRILPHTRSDDPAVRRTARDVLASVAPSRDDVAMWLDEARSADRNTAESTARGLVAVAEGLVEGEVADAVLHLLRDGTEIKKAFVMRGLQQAKRFDGRVEARLLEIVRAAPARDYDSAYFFHFLTPRWAPKSDAVVDLLLERTASGTGEVETIVRGFGAGLSESQRARVAAALATYFPNAVALHARLGVAQGLALVASREQVALLESFAASEGNATVKESLRRAIEAAKRR